MVELLFVLLYLNACVYLALLWRYGHLKLFQEGSSRKALPGTEVGHWSVIGRSTILHWSHLLFFATLGT